MLKENGSISEEGILMYHKMCVQKRDEYVGNANEFAILLTRETTMRTMQLTDFPRKRD